MVEVNISQQFRLKNIDETRSYFAKVIKQNKFMCKKNKKICTTLNNIEHIFILASRVTGCISISAFASLVGIPLGITSSAAGLKLFAKLQELKSITQWLRKRKRSMIK